MDNKKILFGLIGVGALAGLYFWNKNRKSGTNIIADATSTTNTNLSAEATDKLARQYADEMVTELDKEISYITLNPQKSEPSQTKFSFNDNKADVLVKTLENYRLEQQLGLLGENKLNNLKRLKNNYGNIYLMFKKSIPNFKNTDDLNTAKNIIIKMYVYGDEGIRNGRVSITKDEQIWMADNQNLGESFGFDLSPIETGRKKIPNAVATITTK
jgi:hypothetical protein